MSTPAELTPPRRTASTLIDDGIDLRWRCRAGREIPLIFLSIWLSFWTAGCVVLAVTLINEFSWFLLLFAIPFWASWVFVAGLLVYRLFAWEALHITAERLVFRRTAILPLAKREIPLADVHRVEQFTDSSDETTVHGLQLQSRGTHVRFAKGMEDEERTWLLTLFNQRLRDLRGSHAGVSDESSRSTDTRETDKITAMDAADASRDEHEPGAGSENKSRVLDPDQRFAAPAESAWRLFHDYEGIHFEKRGRWEVGTLGSLLFINLFWNGIVGVFVCVLLGIAPLDNGPIVGMQWWFMFFFLIPFELVGLVMFLGLIHQLVAPWRVTRWTLGRYEIRRRNTWFGLGRTKAWQIDRPDRVEIREGPEMMKRLARGWVSFSVEANSENEAAGMQAAVVVVDRHAHDVCWIGPLTTGEAEWIGSTLRYERPEWFAA